MLIVDCCILIARRGAVLSNEDAVLQKQDARGAAVFRGKASEIDLAREEPNLLELFRALRE